MTAMQIAWTLEDRIFRLPPLAELLRARHALKFHLTVVGGSV